MTHVIAHVIAHTLAAKLQLLVNVFWIVAYAPASLYLITHNSCVDKARQVCIVLKWLLTTTIHSPATHIQHN